MRPISSAILVGRHALGAVVEAIVIVAIVVTVGVAALVVSGSAPEANSVLAARGGGSTLAATISFAGTARVAASSGDVTFAVTRTVADNDPVIWVTTKCYSASGTLRSWVDLPVQWGAADSLAGTAGSFATAGTRCFAYVTLRPWQSRVLGDAAMWFDVAS